MREPIGKSTITCPQCGSAKVETMPVDAWQFLYDCTGCGALLRPKKEGLLRVLLVWIGGLPLCPASGRSESAISRYHHRNASS
jgi:hypothetical protein